MKCSGAVIRPRLAVVKPGLTAVFESGLIPSLVKPGIQEVKPGLPEVKLGLPVVKPGLPAVEPGLLWQGLRPPLRSFAGRKRGGRGQRCVLGTQCDIVVLCMGDTICYRGQNSCQWCWLVICGQYSVTRVTYVKTRVTRVTYVTSVLFPLCVT